MVVESVAVLDFRNLAACEVSLGPGVNLIWGENGAGKTNLLEATYSALAGRSCRTRDDRETIAFGRPLARSEATVAADGRHRTFLSSVSRGDGRRHLIDGSPAGPEAARLRPALAVFMPDRLALVKGPPGPRRAHLDGFCAALWPSRGEARRRYSRALAQRNSLLGRIAGGRAGRASLDAWDLELAQAGVELISIRAEGVERLAPAFELASGALGLGDGPSLRYRPRSEATDGRRARRRARRAPRRRHRSRLHRLGTPPRRARSSRPAGARCAATARRDNSGRRCWRCCSPSAARCSTTAARRR